MFLNDDFRYKPKIIIYKTMLDIYKENQKGHECTRLHR